MKISHIKSLAKEKQFKLAIRVLADQRTAMSAFLG